MKNTFLLLLCLVSFLGEAQIKIIERAELPYEKDYDKILFEPNGEKGILQFAIEDDYREALIKVRTQTYDTNLSFVREDFISIPNERFEIHDAEYIDGKLHLKLNDDDEFLRYVIYDPETGDTTVLNYKAQPKNKSFFTRFNRNKLYIFERSKKTINMAIWDLETGEQTKRPLKPRDVKAKHFLIQGVYFPADDVSNEDIFILGYIRVNRGNYINKLYHLHPDGIMDETLLSSAEMPVAKDISILWVPDSDRYLLFGSYGERTTTSGLFLGKLENEEFEIIQKYTFGEDFDSLLVAMPKLTQKWKNWLKKRAHKRGEKFELDLLTISHPITRLDDGGFLWVTELYHPTYRQVPTTGANGTVTYTSQFDGYQTSHAVLARIDSQGKLLWDRAFGMMPLEKPYFPKRFLTIKLSDDQVNFLYQRGRYMEDRSYDFAGKKLFESEQMQILTDEDEKASYSSKLDLKPWYGEYFIAAGYQKIKNKEDRDKSRKVFSINKLKIQKK